MPCYKCGKDEDPREHKVGYSLQKIKCSCGCERLCHSVCAGYPAELYFTEQQATEMKWWCSESVFASNFKKLLVSEKNEPLKLTNLIEQANENLQKNEEVDNIEELKKLLDVFLTGLSSQVNQLPSYVTQAISNVGSTNEELKLMIDQINKKLVSTETKLNKIVKDAEEIHDIKNSLSSIDFMLKQMKKWNRDH